MRPLPVVLLVVSSAAALVAALVFLGRDGGPPADAGVHAPASQAESGAPPTAPSLEDSGEKPDAGRAASILPVSAEGSPQAARARGAAAEDPVLLTGRVLGNLGRPIEGATVYAAEATGFSDLPLDEVEGDVSWVRRVEATTDREGRFRIRPIARSQVTIAVRAPGFAPLDREFALAGAEKDLGDLSLDASVLLSGRVVDASGQPVQGARLARLSTSPMPVFLGGARGAKVAETEAGGNFRIDQIAAGAWRLLVTHEDHPDLLQSGETERPGSVQSGLLFTLGESATIQGRVVGAPAGVAPTLSVRAVPRPAEPAAAESEAEIVGAAAPSRGSVRQARCAADGTFTLKGLEKGLTYRLTARDEGRGFLSRARSAPATAQAGDRGVELPYRPETALVFQVVDGETNAPVVDLAVQAGYGFRMPLLDDEGRPVRRFPQGRVRYGNLPARSGVATSGGAATSGSESSSGLQLRVEAAGYDTYERDDIAVLEGQDTDLGIVRLERAPVVTVRVLDDATGQPVAEAAVSLAEEKPQQELHGRSISITTDDADGEDDFFLSGSAQRARTGADGHASVTSLPGKSARLEVRHKGYARYRSEPILLPESESVERTVRLVQGGTVSVEVVDSHGQAVAGAEIDHQGPENDPGEVVVSGSDGRTDAEGRLDFEHLQAGTHRFKLRQAGGGGGFVDVGGGRALVRRMTRQGGPEEAGWTSVEVADRSMQALRLVAPARGSLAGRITEAGKALADATVRLVPPDAEEVRMPFGEGQREVRTDGSGEYLLDGIDEGEYRIEVEHSSRAMAHEAQARVREGRNELDLDLPVAIVEGTVTGEDGKPVAGARVRAEPAPEPGENRRRAVSFSVMVLADGSDEPEVSVGSPPGSSPPVFTDAEGHYSLRGVRSDVDILVGAESKDAQPARSAAFHVSPDEVKRNVDLKLERGGAIEVTVQGPGGGRAAGGFLVRAVAVAGEREPKVQVVGPGGTARITGLKPGTWRVNLDRLGGPLAGDEEAEIPEREIEVRAGETAKASFDVP